MSEGIISSLLTEEKSVIDKAKEQIIDVYLFR